MQTAPESKKHRAPSPSSTITLPATTSAFSKSSLILSPCHGRATSALKNMPAISRTYYPHSQPIQRLNHTTVSPTQSTSTISETDFDTIIGMARETMDRITNLSIEDVEAWTRIAEGQERLRFSGGASGPDHDFLDHMSRKALEYYNATSSLKKQARLLTSLYQLSRRPETELFPLFERLWDRWTDSEDTDAATASYILCNITLYGDILLPGDPMLSFLAAETERAVEEATPSDEGDTMEWPGLSLPMALHRLRFTSATDITADTRRALLRHYLSRTLTYSPLPLHRLSLLADCAFRISDSPSLSNIITHLPSPTNPHDFLTVLSIMTIYEVSKCPHRPTTNA